MTAQTPYISSHTYCLERINRLKEYVGNCATTYRNTSKAPHFQPTGRIFPSAPPTIFNFDLSDRSILSGWGGRTIEHHHHYHQDSSNITEQKNDQNVFRVIAVIVGIIGVLFAALRHGESLQNIKNARAAWNRSLEAHFDLLDIDNYTYPQKSLPKTAELASKKLSLDVNAYSKYFYLSIHTSILLAGSAALITGGLLASSLLMTAGAITAVAATALMLGTSAYYSNQMDKQQIANLTKGSITELEKFKTALKKEMPNNNPANFNFYIPVGTPISQEELNAYYHSYFAPSAPPAED